jgi:CubicO group peptidase (beta-lactamase class C family)
MRLLLVFLVGLSARAWGQVCPLRTSWPTEDWSTNLVGGEKAAEVQALEDYAFTLTGKDEERRGLRTDGLRIIKNGSVVYERYARGFGPNNRHLSWSVAKSISSALIGVAVKEGVLTLDDSICAHLPEFSGTPQCAIRVKDTITFGTGLAWQEGYENGSYQESSIISMLFGVGRRDFLKFILSHAMSAEPGTQWRYSTADAHLACNVGQRALGTKFGKDAFWKVLFDPIGMKGAVLEGDTQDSCLGGSHVFATPREFAKFGFLYLNDGCWDGKRLLPAGWVQSSTSVSSLFTSGSLPQESMPSGYAWWLNQPMPEKNRPAPWPQVPLDTFAAIGHWGQYIIVVPSEDVVIVRTGDDRLDDGLFSVNTITRLSVAVAR